MCFHSHSVHAGVWTDVAGHVLKKLDHVVNLFIVDDFRASLLGQLQTIVKAVNGDHPFSAEKKSASNGELADGAATPDRHCIAGLDVAVFCAHIAGGKDV